MFKKVYITLILAVIPSVISSEEIDFEDEPHVIRKRSLGDGPDPDIWFSAARDTKFLLFTPNNPIYPQTIVLNDTTSLSASSFNASQPTRFIIHGWLNNQYSLVNTLIRQAYFQKGNYNIITVDWSLGSGASYDIVKLRLPFIGKTVAMFIDFLNEADVLEFSDIIVVGFSFGAHISGFTGKHVTQGRIPIIYALDAAQPLLEGSLPEERLDKTDADYVGLIHTNTAYWGFKKPIGHADFYPNFGVFQIYADWVTSHERSVYYFAESINSAIGFHGISCLDETTFANNICNETDLPSEVLGGEPINVNAVGVYYVPVGPFSPFATNVISNIG